MVVHGTFANSWHKQLIKCYTNRKNPLAGWFIASTGYPSPTAFLLLKSVKGTEKEYLCVTKK
jgi:hypothetical protein